MILRFILPNAFVSFWVLLLSVAFQVFPFAETYCMAQSFPVKPAQDYFDSPQGQSYHRQKIISSMKKEVNSYSERLHDLQSRFYEIFYDQNYDKTHEVPFQNTLNPQPPASSKEKSVGRYQSPRDVLVEESPSQRLAFEVDLVNDANPIDSTAKGSRFLGSGKGYWILRPGLVLPHQEREGSFGGAVKRRKYKPGFSVDLAGGYSFDKLRIGIGGIFRRNELDKESWEGAPGNSFKSGSSSRTFAGYLDLGIVHPLSTSFDIHSGLGLGYGVSIVEDFSPVSSSIDRTRYDPTFFGFIGVGARWKMSDRFALDFAYRYLLEDEAPAHSLSLGLAGRF